MRLSEIADLPPTLTVTAAGEILGLSRSAAYEAVRLNLIPSIRIGGRVVIPTARLLASLGIDIHTLNLGRETAPGAHVREPGAVVELKSIAAGRGPTT